MGNRWERQAGRSWGALDYLWVFLQVKPLLERCAYFKAFGTHSSSSLQERHSAGSKVGASRLDLDLKMQDKQIERL